MNRRARRVILSFDVEEFDIPLEYGQRLPEEEQFQVSHAGLVRVLGLLTRLGIPATFFTTARFALRYPDAVKQLAQGHEVASHGVAHSTFENADLSRSRAVLESITGAPVVGFRRPRMAPTDHNEIQAAGYRYSSSENPIYLPGRYNNFFRPRRPYFSGELLNIPVSATPLIRFPLFWLSFKNVPLSPLKAAALWTLAADGWLNLYFHPWEFADLSAYTLPAYVKRPDGERLLARLALWLEWLKRRAAFTTFAEYDRTARSDRIVGH